MSQVLCDESYVSAIAEAIRNQNGLGQTYKLSEMASAISNLSVSDSTIPLIDLINVSTYRTILSEDTITSLRSHGFAYNNSLQSVCFAKCNGIEPFAFSNCYNLQNAVFPEAKYVGEYAFINCYSLNNVSIPLVGELYSGVFRSCSSLSALSISKCRFIYGYAFADCINLSSLYLGSNCRLYYSDAFSNISPNLSIYVPSTYVNTYKSSTNWSYFSSRIVGY